jgi:hypothetical protein
VTGEEYADLGATVQSAIATIIGATAPTAKVLQRDPVNIDEALWLGSLLSDSDTDASGDKRVHAWLVTFAGSEDPTSTTIRAIEPVLPFKVQLFLSHEFGTAADSSEGRMRAEVLKVQYALAASPRLGLSQSLVQRHMQLSMRVRLARMGVTIVHRGEGEISVEVQPAVTH